MSPVVDCLCSLEVGHHEARDWHRLHAGPDLVSTTRDLAEALDDLGTRLEYLVATSAKRWLFVHAGVVAFGEHAILIPGRSRSGKTTLVSALVRAGATYYSDEFAVLDGAGWVHPWARPLRIRDPHAVRRRRCHVEGMGGQAGQRALRVGLVAVTEYRSGASWRPRMLSRGEALLALLGNTVQARARPGFALRTLKRAVRHAMAIESRRGEAEEVAAPLLGHWDMPQASNGSIRGC